MQKGDVEMQRISPMGLALLVAIALSGIASAPASAASFCYTAELYEGKPSGNYAASDCTGTAVALQTYVLFETATYIGTGLWCVKTAAGAALLPATNTACNAYSSPVDTGTYTRVEGPAIALEQGRAFPAKVSSSTGLLVFSGSGINLECNSATASGEIESYEDGKATIAATGCQTAFGKCKTGSKAGEIVASVTSKLVSYTNSKEEDKVGLLLAVSQTKITCGGIPLEVKGSVIAALTSQEGKGATSLAFGLNLKEGKQEIEEKEKPLEISVSGGKFEPATLTGELSESFEAEVMAL
jgi:hypothetical protein